MERIRPMNELQIQEKVEDLAGKSAKIVDYEQSTMNQMEEVLLVNGVPISLTGEEGAKIKEALIHGEVPPCDLVNNMLIRAGIEKNPVELETTMNVKSCIKTLEHSTLLDSNGVLVDEKLREKEDEDEFKTVNVEIWNTEHSSMDKSEEIKQSAPAQIKTFIDKENEVESISEGTKSNKKSMFSPISIIKSNKSDSKNKKKAQEQLQQQQHQLDPVQVNIPSEPESPNSNLPTTDTKNVSNKNKFLSLFTKGKSKDKNTKHSEGKSKDKNNSNETKNSEGKSSKTKIKNETILEDSKKKSFLDKSKPDTNTNTNNTLPNKETKKQNANVNYLDPSLSLVHVEIDGIPVRVTYETFV